MSVETKEEAKPYTPARSYYHGYYDPEADTVLRSNDGMFFRVHSYFLKAARSVHVIRYANCSQADDKSLYFRSLPSKFDSPGVEDEEAVVSVDGNGRDWKNLLDLLTGSTQASNHSWSAAKHIIPLTQQYGFHHITELLLGIDYNAGDAWSVFDFASQHDLESVAQSAIANLQFSRKWRNMTTLNLKASYFTDVPPRYIIALVRAMRDNEAENNWGHLKVDWDEAAKSFMVIS